MKTYNNCNTKFNYNHNKLNRIPKYPASQKINKKNERKRKYIMNNVYIRKPLLMLCMFRKNECLKFNHLENGQNAKNFILHHFDSY